MKKKRTLQDKIVFTLFPLAGTVFMVTLFVIFWSFILENKFIVLSVSGGLIVLFALMGYFKKGKFIRGFRKRLR